MRTASGNFLAAAASALLGATLMACSAGSITVPRYALSYGVSDYAYDQDDLTYPASDASSMMSLLVANGYESGREDGIEAARTNSAVTKQQIKSDILGLASLDSDSIVTIFYASHGTYLSDGYYEGYSGAYLVPYDAINQDGNRNLDCLISPTELSDWISQSGKSNVIVLINTCFSGAFVDSGSSIDIAPQNYGPMDWGTTPSALWSAIENFGLLLSMNSSESESSCPIVISSAGSDESAYDGVFPYYVRASATNGDSDGNGYVTATEAYAYAVAGIKSYWNARYQYTYDSSTDMYADFMPHISGGARDLVLFVD